LEGYILENKNKNIRELLLNGLCHDLMMLNRNIELFDAIKNNWSNRNLLSSSDLEWLIFLKDTAIQQSVLYLGKLYDSSNNKNYSTRCIRELLKSVNCTFSFDVLSKNHQESFVNKHKLAFETINCEAISIFIDDLRTFLDNQFDPKIPEEFILKRVIKIRNKIVAHNEAFDYEISIFFEDALKLQKVAEALLDFVNIYCDTDYKCYYNKTGLMKIQIEKMFNK
jgi:hypothetical protein